MPQDFKTHRPTLSRTAADARMPLKDIAERELLRHSGAAAVLIKEGGDILYVHGRTGQYLEPSTGVVHMNVVQMAREGLGRELTSALQQARADGVSVTRPPLQVKTNGSFSSVNLTIRPVAGFVEPKLFLVVFEEAAAAPTPKPSRRPAARGATDAPGSDARIEALTEELRAKDDYLKSAQEEMQSTNEELMSSNEELQSTNEELQSTNEELETSKEELQSVNEELATVNNELQAKVAALSRVNNDMNNLLAATGIGTIYVDLQLRIQRFTPAVSKLINVIATDKGRPLRHIVTNLVGYASLADDVQATLDSLVPKDIEVQTTVGTWFLLSIRPYRTVENAIEGAVITFVEITEVKPVKQRLAAAEALNRLAVVVRDANDAIIVHDMQGAIRAWNPAAERLYGWTEAEALGMRNAERIASEARKAELEVERALADAQQHPPRSAERITQDGQIVAVWITSSLLVGDDGKPYGIASTESRRAEPEPSGGPP